MGMIFTGLTLGTRIHCLRRPVRLALLGLVAGAGSVQGDCLPMAVTPYERIYCDIRNQGKGAGLPDFAQFQNNPPTTQRLLLKRPAGRLGIKLPAVSSKGAPSAMATVVAMKNSSASPQSSVGGDIAKRKSAKAGEQGLGPVKGEGPRKAAAPVIGRQSEDNLVSRCRQHSDRIRCGDNQYRLQGNLPNRVLEPDALEDGNRLRLVPYSGGGDDPDALNRYLGGAYQQYIDKMLEIGLGGVTMSYSRFYYTYLDLQESGHDFAGRFETMFEYLKRDKRHLVVGRAPPPAFDGLKYCMALDRRLIVCDNQRVNWVYRLEN
ncbi:hypothetical protein [Aestuariirhabdus sp. LZHN29]|uniref:hypothetical protein n=1 Tax=Aestuariirhabdus sp. LZHN29 TaxID=3417462 RepID=UPI003CF0E277